MSVFWDGVTDMVGWRKKLQSQKLRSLEQFVTVKLKNADFRVSKPPAQMAFWTFIGTFSKVADFTTFEACD